MNIFEKLQKKINNDLSTRTLIKCTLLLLIIFLVIQTGSFWKWIGAKVWSILFPFVIGFVIAYILKEPIEFGVKHHVKRGVMIGICYCVIFAGITLLLMSVIPMLLSRTGDFINSMISGVNWLSTKYSELSYDNQNNAWVFTLVQQATKSLRNLSSLVPEVSNMIPAVLNNAIGTVTNGIFAIIISIFMCISWEKIRVQILVISRKISRLCYECVLSVNEEVGGYIHSLLILMIIKFFEYSLVYLLIGHEDWGILALLTSISLLIPYIGPTIVNCIGILTSVSLPDGKVVLLIILIVVLSQVDEYVIAPLVHSRNTAVTPLWALFSIFAGSALLGVTGLIIAIPAYLAIRVVIEKQKEFDELGVHE